MLQEDALRHLSEIFSYAALEQEAGVVEELVLR